MTKVFISYSSKDYYFVSLLQELLKFHYIDVWCSASDIQPGTQFPAGIEQAIKDASLLLVVASSNTSTSKWVTKEITAFQTRNEAATVVPLLLDSTDLDSISPGLNYYQAIDFSESMLEGYQQLFRLFKKDFLSYQDRRNQKEGRRSVERRVEERRKTSLPERMRRGLWASYSKATGRGEFDEFTDSLRERFKVLDSLKGEMQKYQYLDEAGQQCDPLRVLELVIHAKWNELKNTHYFKPVYLIQGMVDEIFEKYELKSVSERRTTTRRATKERREKPDQ